MTHHTLNINAFILELYAIDRDTTDEISFSVSGISIESNTEVEVVIELTNETSI